jgi:hypothetical protein
MMTLYVTDATDHATITAASDIAAHDAHQHNTDWAFQRVNSCHSTDLDNLARRCHADLIGVIDGTTVTRWMPHTDHSDPTNIVSLADRGDQHTTPDVGHGARVADAA